LGLRHLCVVDSKNIIKGMITREDLYKLQHWEVTLTKEKHIQTLIHLGNPMRLSCH
jgi:hypothetical protein